ncbi:MAG: LPXTG cell wall anchor domain-containing protein [Clostridiales bacterium]|nr:LPXTG cell wall anchor domain-containing protein [Clostridiales bacterium]
MSDERIGEYEAALADEDGGMEILAGYSITLLDAAGNAVEPDGTVSVSVTSDALKACQADGNIQIIHNLNTTADAMEDDAVDSETISVEALEVVSAVSDGSGEIDFTMDSFSEIVIPGGSGIALTAANVTYVAKVEGGSQYETLAEAIADASDGDTVTLLGDIDLTGYITIGKSITLDLNGQTITEESGVTASDSGFEYTSGSYCLIYISDTGSLTIQDSDSGGNITAAVISYCIASTGTVKLESGTIEAATSSSCRAIDVTGGTVEMSGGVINSASRGIYAKGAGIDITISGGSISVKSNNLNGALGIRAADGVALTVSGGSISVTNSSNSYNAYGIYVTDDNSALTISDVSVSVNSTGSNAAAFGIFGYNSAVLSVSDGDIYATSSNSNAYAIYAAGELTVTGGSFYAESNSTGVQYAAGLYAASGANIVVDDGYFSGLWGLSMYGSDSADKTTIVVNGGTFIGLKYDGTTSSSGASNIYFEINGGSISSLYDGIYMPNKGELVINGGEITGESTGIQIRSGEMTINGGSIVSTGTCSDSNAMTGSAIAINYNGNDSGISVTINDGTFNGTTYGLYQDNLLSKTNTGEVVSIDINGGTFTADSSGESVKVNALNTNGSRNGTYIVSITGGYFSKHVYSSDYIANGYICIDNLTGTYSGYHAVVPDTITSANTVVTLSETSFVYNAQAQVPSVTVALAGVTLTEGKHYTVSYSDGSAALAAENVINVGDYTVTVTSTGSTALCEVFAADTNRQNLTLSGSATESFEITAATPTVALTGVSSKTYDGEAVSAPAVSVSLVGSDTYSGTPVITYYSVASDGTLTKLDGAPSAVGDYMVVAEVSDAGDNYNSASASATFTISEAGTDADDTDDQEDDDTTTSSAASEETSADASSAVQTGDTNPVLPLAGTCAAALAVIAVLVVRRRKRA